ncbi:MAG: acetylxylan esterase [Planctomycetes bacterium]|nr:acetylxylan esterase [Planctomycetota bacterium]
MDQKTTQFYFSPSEQHSHLLKNTEQKLAFASSNGDVKKWQGKLRGKLKKLLGLPKNDGIALKVRSLWKQDHQYGSIEKIIYRAESHCDVMAYVCTPHNSVRLSRNKMEWFVCLQGHSTGAHNSIGVKLDDNFKTKVIEGDRDFGIGCMQRGIAALCIEQRAFGERAEKSQERISGHGCHDATMHALALGRTLVGERVYDIDRGLDYLKTRDDVNWKKVGVMGNSGGGTASLFAAAVLPRLQYAMPSCYLCTFESCIMSIYHCADNYIPGILQYAEMADIMGLFAPHPVVIVAGKDDEIFPIAGVRKAFKQLKKIYTAAGAAENCKLVIGDGGHRFYAAEGWNAMEKYLKKAET